MKQLKLQEYVGLLCTKLLTPVTTITNLGVGSIQDSGATVLPVVIQYHTTTAVNVQVHVDDSGTSMLYVATGTSVTELIPITFADGDSINFKFSIPIVGWDF